MSFSDLTREGRLAFAVGMAMLGLCSLIWGDLNPGLQPALQFFGSGQGLAYLAGAFLFITGLALFMSRLVRIAGLALAAFWLVWIVLGHSLAVRQAPGDVTVWVSLAEAGAMVVAAWLASASHYGAPSRRVQLTSRAFVGLMLVGFGVVHLMYREAIAGMIPDWMPLRDLWPWVTSAANIAAGLALITGIQGRLAGALVGVMFASWILLVHIPHLIAEPQSRTEWTALALNFALVGAVWITGSAAFRRPA